MKTENGILSSILDSDNKNVGGGSAAALAGSMAAALVAMVAKLSLKKDYGLKQSEYEALGGEADEISAVLKKGSEEDEQAYGCIKNAMSMPKTSAEEKASRKGAIEEALIKAALVPKDNAWKCCRVQEIAKKLKGHSNPGAKSDLDVARYLAYSALVGCLANVKINIDSLPPGEARSELEKELKKLNELCTYPAEF
ncbi:MAG: cyclodeaminase/cyclohydrolase family protein [Bacillota bacterium]